MFTFTTLLLFMGISLLLIFAPGPDLIFTITQGMTNGKKAGMATALGLSLGNTVHTLAAALGLSVIFQTSALAFILFKVLGSAYLFFLAYKAIRYRKEPVSISPDGLSQTKHLFLRGLVMNILNPKVSLFFLTFLPQFADDHYGHVPLQMVILGMIFIGLTALIFGMFGYFAGSFSTLLLKRPRFSEYMNIAAAVIFIGLGMKLLTAATQ